MLTQEQKNLIIKKFEQLGFPENVKPQIPGFLDEAEWNVEVALTTLFSFCYPELQEQKIRENFEKLFNPPPAQANPFNPQQFGNQMTAEQQQLLQQMLQVQQFEKDQENFAIQQSLVKQDDKPLNERMREQGIPVGLQNFGNTCYFNCILQIIFANPTLTELILNFRPLKGDQPPILKAQQKFLYELQLILARLMITNEKYKKPEEVYKAAQELQKIVANKQKGEFQVGNFYDVSEYFDTILSLIDQSLQKRADDQQRLNTRTIFENNVLHREYCSKRRISDRDEFSVQFHFTAADQFIYQSFYQEIQQHQQQFQSLPNNIVITLSRQIEDKQKQDTEYWFSTKIYLDLLLGNQAAIDRIQHHVIRSQSNEEIELSKKFQREILAFERVIKHYEGKLVFSSDVVQSLKIELAEKVELSLKYFPRNIEELNFALRENSQHAYYLHMIVVHVGSASTGHYYMYIHNFHQNKWYKFNDYNVTIESEDNVMNDSRKNGNILFYITQEQRSKVEQYEKEIKEIEQKLFQLGENLPKIDQSNMRALTWIPPNFFKQLLENENRSFQREHDDFQAAIEKSKEVR